MSKTSPFALPYLAEIFQLLCRGRHICIEDGNIYFALRENPKAYTDLFFNLGFELEMHSREFYYFHGGKSLSAMSEKMSLFMFILMEHIEGQGELVEHAILTKNFLIDELPHFSSERYQNYMKESGVESVADLAAIVGNLDKFGFVQRQGESFRFKAPVYRFFDICSGIAQEGRKSGESEKEQVK
jgi:hypothetical protein